MGGCIASSITMRKTEIIPTEKYDPTRLSMVPSPYKVAEELAAGLELRELHITPGGWSPGNAVTHLVVEVVGDIKGELIESVTGPQVD